MRAAQLLIYSARFRVRQELAPSQPGLLRHLRASPSVFLDKLGNKNRLLDQNGQIARSLIQRFYVTTL